MLIAPVAILVILGGTLVGRERLAFRDVSHFYLPLYDYVAERTSEQWLPLWNELDQTGMPLLGETTTAVLYPLRYFLFALPISSELAISWYVALHLLIASLTARWAARCAGAGPMAATLAGIIYPLSGGVFFLYTNPPYLVGAAWLPLVLGALTQQTTSVARRCLIAGPAMAMMILGGDPQSALHAMLVGFVVFAVRYVTSKQAATSSAAITLLAVPLMAACLTAPQLAASLSWSSQSDRVHDGNRGAWYLPPKPGSHRHNAFQFSLPPWHTASLLTPNAWGRLFPSYQRYSVIISGDGRMWTPTLYLGMLAAIALMSRLIRRQMDVWLAIAIIALLLCLGHFGAAWCLQQIPGLLPHADSAIGGPYWILYQCLPGYDSFRYPVKWLPVFSLAVAVTTALWIDKLDWATAKKCAAILFGLLLAGWLLGETFFANADRFAGFSDTYWGPLDVGGSHQQFRQSILHSVISLAAIAVCLWRWNGKSTALFLVLTLIVAVDVAASSYANIARVSRSAERSIVADRNVQSARRWMRTREGDGWPDVWQRTGSTNRVLEVAASERKAWFGRWHLGERQAVINNMTSIRSHQMAMFWRASNQVTASMVPQESAAYWRAITRWLEVDGVLVTSRQADNTDGLDLVAVRFHHQSSSPVHFHTTWQAAPKRDEESLAALLGDLVDGKSSPLVHSHVTAPTASKPAEYRVTTSDGLFQIETDTTGLLTRPVFQDGHWCAEISPAESDQYQPVDVHAVSYLKQGIFVSPGKWKVRFRYQPDWLPWSIAIAAASWLLLLAWLAICFRRFFEQNRST